LVGFVAGIIFWGGFNTALELTNTEEFCISCHEMRDNVYPEYKETIQQRSNHLVERQHVLEERSVTHYQDVLMYIRQCVLQVLLIQQFH
jgi:nitrate/TMAO reductase-like tetraheme cytochrome c subunit